MDLSEGELVGALATPDGEIAAFVTTRPDGYWYYLAGITRAGVPVGPYATFQAATAAGLAALGIDAEVLLAQVRKQAGPDGESL